MSELAQAAAEPAGLIRNNPVWTWLLGLSPLLAVSTSLVNGFALGVTTLIVLLAGVTSLHYLPALRLSRFRFAYSVLLLACFSTALMLLLQWAWPGLLQRLGVYLPLVCCNFVLLLHLETHAGQARLGPQLVASGRLGLAYLGALIAFSALREMLTGGTLLADWQLLLPGTTATARSMERSGLADFLANPAGALLLLGLLLAAGNRLSALLKPRQAISHSGDAIDQSFGRRHRSGGIS